jgi:hypothetical protein
VFDLDRVPSDLEPGAQPGSRCCVQCHTSGARCGWVPTLRQVLRVLRFAASVVRACWQLLPKPEPLSDEEQWPSVGLAYDLVKSSYDQVARRIDAQENRIRATMTFATTVTLVTFAALTVLTGPL